MIFLKNFYAEGFKSFAKPVNLNFSSTMIGIIGPNGSGKSNIVDALKWTIGEQSIKTLRGKEKSNLIFAGSNDMNEADYAYVELTFDNSKKILNHNSEEVKISRKLIRKTGESIFQINDENVRLKEIQDLFLDTGLTKGSLGIISQGTVNWFAEAKPEDRRHMFEEAAGIGRYTKQKNETIEMLNKANQNLENLNTHVSNLKDNIKKLSKQAEKAKTYKDKNDELKTLDVSFSIQNYLSYKDEYDDVKSFLDINKNDLDKLKTFVDENKTLKDKYNNEYLNYEKELNDLIHIKDNLNKQINELNIKKVTFTNNLENNLNSSNKEERIKSYISLISSDKEELISFEKQLNKNNDEFDQNKSQMNEINSKFNDANNEFQEIYKNYVYKEKEYERLVELQNNQSNGERGVKTILNSKNVINGIHSTVSNIINVDEKYEIAIQTALGKSMNNIVVDNSDVAIKAINYLKNNNAGRATFLPLNQMKPKNIKEDSYLIVSKLNGYVDIASNLVKYNVIYKNIVDSLLGNIVIANNIENANYIAKMINYNYKVISLDGDIVYVGGALSGGQQLKSSNSIFNIEEKIQKVKYELDNYNVKVREQKSVIESFKDKLSILEIKNQNLNNSITVLKTKIQTLKDRIQRNEINLKSIDDSIDKNAIQGEINQFEKDLINLNELWNENDKKLKTLSELKMSAYDLYTKCNLEYERSNKQYFDLNEKLLKKQNLFNSLEHNISDIENKINNYGMTLEFAISQYSTPLEMSTHEIQNKIIQLKNELGELGNINFEAVEQLSDEEQKLSLIENEYENARDSVINLKNIIIELDNQAKKDFSNIINSVNKIIPNIFNNLFGGGTCELKYTNPNDILASGIEIVVQPLGKKVSNLVLLSGGEKTLVALTILFALLKASHFPLVVLDEAEAALDQTNVSAFAKLIQEFSDVTQFLVITHRSGTMKMCDVLYGTAMQIKGVTKVFKTDLNQLKQNNTIREN